MAATAVIGVCVRKLGKTNRTEQELESSLNTGKDCGKMDEASLLQGALKQKSIEKGENWLSKTEQELNTLGMGDTEE
jgi:hypothetical protein